MIQSPALKALAAKLVRAEVERRRPVDIETLTDFVTRQIDVSGSGELVAVSEDGAPRIGPGPAYNSMGLSELLDEIEAARPALFGKSTKPSASASNDSENNPFAKGPNFSVTDQMMIWRTDPERAERLAADAGMKIGTSR